MLRNLDEKLEGRGGNGRGGKGRGRAGGQNVLRAARSHHDAVSSGDRRGVAAVAREPHVIGNCFGKERGRDEMLKAKEKHGKQEEEGQLARRARCDCTAAG
jgi:hypothetical protein